MFDASVQIGFSFLPRLFFSHMNDFIFFNSPKTQIIISVKLFSIVSYRFRKLLVVDISKGLFPLSKYVQKMALMMLSSHNLTFLVCCMVATQTSFVCSIWRQNIIVTVILLESLLYTELFS